MRKPLLSDPKSMNVHVIFLVISASVLAVGEFFSLTLPNDSCHCFCGWCCCLIFSYHLLEKFSKSKIDITKRNICYIFFEIFDAIVHHPCLEHFQVSVWLLVPDPFPREFLRILSPIAARFHRSRSNSINSSK